MQVCIKKRRFIRLFFGGERGKGAEVAAEARRERITAALYPSESSPPNPLAIRTNGTVVPLAFLPYDRARLPSSSRFLSQPREKRQEREKVKRLEGADVRHLPAFISFYPGHPPPTDWRRSNDNSVNDVRSPFRYASADSLC